MGTRLRLSGATLCILAGCASVDSGPLTPRAALQSFRIAEGFRIELFAAEPHVVDPVEMAFDEDGGIYVAELLDNPEDPPDGGIPLSRIKYLEDRDGDGEVDHHTIFADAVLGVEGIAVWRGGLIATAAPDVLYLKDTDGDHRADIRETLYTGFALAHVEGRISNPRLGLDNWFYVVNNGYPGEVTSPSNPERPPVNVRNREFRFHPLRGVAEASTGDAQFGHSYNRWGHWFIAQNTVHLRHTVIPPGYLQRNPLLSIDSAEQDISDHGRPAAAVYPISKPQQWRVERTQARQRRYAETRPGRTEQLAGYFTAAAGTTVYDGDAFPSEFEDAVFVGEGNGNLVHCDLLEPEGATYTASRWPRTSDFLVSPDNWFRPVNFSNGPDGNLYVLDYYRQYLEHPNFIPEAVKRRLQMDFRAGDTLGRIYRIVPEISGGSDRPAQLGSLSSGALVRLLGHSNGWHRRTSHRLLVERQDKAAVPGLRVVARTHDQPAVRLRALWVLEGLDSLDSALAEQALDDTHPAVRESALRFAEAFPAQLSDRVLEATRDANPRVAFQAVLTAGSVAQSDAAIAALADAVARFPDDRWFHMAALSAPPPMAGPVLTKLVQGHADFFAAPSDARKTFVRLLARVVGARRDSSEIGRILELLGEASPLDGPLWKVAALDGLEQGLSLQEGRRAAGPNAAGAVGRLLNDTSDEVRASAAKIARYFDLAPQVRAAQALALDPSSPLKRRLVAARVLQAGSFADVAESLRTMLREHPEVELRAQAGRSLASFGEPQAAEILLDAWKEAPPELRDTIAETLIRRRVHAMALIGALKGGRVRAEDIATITRIRLAQHPNDQVRSAAATAVALSARDRDRVIAEYISALELSGDPVEGKQLFDGECASCHLARASRGRIGPDLSGVANRSKEDLLTSILDPSYAIEDRYRNHLLETADGRFYDGILVSETSATVTLRGEREDISVLNSNIAELRPSSVSLMPDGFEDTLMHQDLADLIAFLRAGL